MKTKLILVSTTALALVMSGGAYAGSGNNALIAQGNGYGPVSGNVASTDQSTATNSNIGAVGLPASQQSDKNSLYITQIGGVNNVGLAGPDGVKQKQNANWLQVTQGISAWAGYDLYNTVGSVVQDGGNWAYGGTYAGDANRATITQLYKDSVGKVEQTYDGSGLGANTISVNQGGSNNIGLIHQEGHNQTAVVNMATPGYSNGSYVNGQGSFSSGFASTVGNLSSFAATSYATQLAPIAQSTIFQSGAGNNLNFGVNGAGNLFGFRQEGSVNGTTASVTGLANEVVVRQNGAGNLAYATLGDSLNDLGIAQLGDGNIATGNLSGTSNHGLVLQGALSGTNNGVVQTDAGASNNWIAVAQVSNGGSNVGTVHVISGNGNREAVVQYGYGGGTNTATVQISGSNNNNTLTFTSGGYAASVANTTGATFGNLATYYYHVNLSDYFSGGVASALSGTKILTPGLSTQLGSGNSLLINVVNSSSNLFSTVQVGTGNTINSTITGLGNNELAIAQANLSGGTGNTATTSQNGSFNSIGLTQIGMNSATMYQ